jgi:uncharacterized protein
VRLAVVGGLGLVGAPVVEEALVRGHDVTLVTADPARIAPRPRLASVRGDFADHGALGAAFVGQHVVVCVFQPEWDDPHLYDRYLGAARAVLDAVRKAGVPRLLWVGGAGALEASPGVLLADTPEFPARFRPLAFAARETLRLLVREREVDWTMLSPPIHVEEGQRTAIYRSGGDSPIYGAGGESHISAPDLAVAVLDEVERPRHSRHRFTVGY